MSKFSVAWRRVLCVVFPSKSSHTQRAVCDNCNSKFFASIKQSIDHDIISKQAEFNLIGHKRNSMLREDSMSSSDLVCIVIGNSNIFNFACFVGFYHRLSPSFYFPYRESWTVNLIQFHRTSLQSFERGIQSRMKRSLGYSPRYRQELGCNNKFNSVSVIFVLSVVFFDKLAKKSFRSSISIDFCSIPEIHATLDSVHKCFFESIIIER
mmetsp:Transcript_11181/g.15441  ORF Transcript_11181/g.15441 Transcript_11181/m.15441 type:complete len:209 (-) Transcript_11181:238-864(-)